MPLDIQAQGLLDDWTLCGLDKGYPADAPPMHAGHIGHAGWQVLREDLPFPLALLKDEALAHNQRWMRDFASVSGCLLAPHGKTTMAPQLFEQQIDGGCWGLTLATVQQAAVALSYGVRRILLANQLVGRHDIAAVAGWLDRWPELEIYTLVDSLAQAQRLHALLRAAGAARPLPVLIELGHDGGRTGLRDDREALELAHALQQLPALALRGIECYEGLLLQKHDRAETAQVAALLARVAGFVREGAQRSLFAEGPVLVSVGGSAAFDLVAQGIEALRGDGVEVRPILRSGCYIAHDDGFYDGALRAIAARGAVALPPGRLQAALEVWAQVQSCPEPGLAILTMGKRDAGFDMGLPLPKWHFRLAQQEDGMGRPRPLDGAWHIARMNDQHAYLRFAAGDLHAPQVGDLIGCGISHPCTTFDRWKFLYRVDDDYRVTGVVQTFF